MQAQVAIATAAVEAALAQVAIALPLEGNASEKADNLEEETATHQVEILAEVTVTHQAEIVMLLRPMEVTATQEVVTVTHQAVTA